MTWKEWLTALAEIAEDAKRNNGINGAKVTAELTALPPEETPPSLPSPYDELFALTRFVCLEVSGESRSGYAHRFEIQIRVEELPDEPGKVEIWRTESGAERGVLDLESEELECRLDRGEPEVFYRASSFAAWFVDYWSVRIRDSVGELLVR